MKTTKQRLLNIVITMSVAINLVMLAGLAYIQASNAHVERVYSAMNAPVMIYVPQAMEIKTPVESQAAQ